MKQIVADYFKCPACMPREVDLALRVMEVHGGDVITGYLECSLCNTRYPIADGIACLLPQALRSDEIAPSKYERPDVLSSYLWSHYADLFGDPQATAAYGQWASQLQPSAGIALDAGCAVGRFTFELSCLNDFAIGFDSSRSFILTARELLIRRSIDFKMTEEGRIQKDCTIALPSHWDSDRVELIVADAHALPFGAALFSSIASLNLVDKLPVPLLHLKELNRVSRDRNAQFLFSDPFSWSTEITEEKDWLGGLDTGNYAGNGIDNTASLLEGSGGELLPPWSIQNRGSVWWKIRNHRNHFELIRSCFLKAVR